MYTQPLINIGMIGHVSDGKSTLTKSLTGVKTQRYAKEQESNITIRLGYANAIIYKCNNCSAPQCYYSVGLNNENKLCKLCKHCNKEGEIVNHISFVDCPGHNSFMGTMMNGTTVMDYTITVESVVNKTFPAPQTIQHLNAIEMNNIKNIAFILNKIDLVSEDVTMSKIEQLEQFKKKYKCSEAPIIPISAAFDINIDIICEILAKLKKPERESDTEKLRMNIIRSFNVNTPGTDINNLKGGVVGGSIISGTINIKDDVYIYPGIIYTNCYKPLKATVLSLFSEKTPLTSAISGGLIGVGLDIDPGLTGDDALVGNIILKKNNLNNDQYITKNILLKLQTNKDKEEKEEKEDKNIINSKFILNINTNNLFANITEKQDDNIYNFELEKPVFIQKNDKVSILIKNVDSFDFIGQGILLNCKPLIKLI
jgi:translation initiation factor 2 subunit 3